MDRRLSRPIIPMIESNSIIRGIVVAAICAVALRARLSVITGGPGTGKTYTAARLLALLLALASVSSAAIADQLDQHSQAAATLGLEV